MIFGMLGDFRGIFVTNYRSQRSDQHQRSIDYWPASRNIGFGPLTPIPEAQWRLRLVEAADIFHPGGTTRMAASRSQGVVDSDLRAFSIGNLYVVSTSTFPSGGSANPSFMLLAFALRAARQIAQDIARGLPHQPVPVTVSPMHSASL